MCTCGKVKTFREARQALRQALREQRPVMLWAAPKEHVVALVHLDTNLGTVGRRRVTMFDREEGPIWHGLGTPEQLAEDILGWLGADAQPASPELLDQLVQKWPPITDSPARQTHAQA